MKKNTEATACKGTITLVVDPAAQSINCKFAALTQGAICTSCPWNSLCQKLFPAPQQPEQEQSPVKTILVKAFSGMPIGELPITHETKSSIEVVTGKGVTLKFDRKTGLQMNAKNPKYANKIEVAG